MPRLWSILRGKMGSGAEINVRVIFVLSGFLRLNADERSEFLELVEESQADEEEFRGKYKQIQRKMAYALGPVGRPKCTCCGK